MKIHSVILFLFIIILFLLGACSPTVLSEPVIGGCQDYINDINEVHRALEIEYDQLLAQYSDMENQCNEAIIERDKAYSERDKEKGKIASLEAIIIEKSKEQTFMQQEIEWFERQLREENIYPEIKYLNNVTSNGTWNINLSDKLNTIKFGGTGYNDSLIKFFGFISGELGNGSDYIYSHAEEYWRSLQTFNTVIYFNPDTEPWTVFDDWPSDYRIIFPFSVEALQQVQLPFAFVYKDDAYGVYRTIVVASQTSDFELFSRALLVNDIPLGVYWTAE